jgi:hypothetical protein
MFVRLNVFTDEPSSSACRARAILRACTSEFVVELGPQMPFASDSVDEIRLGYALGYADNFVSTMDEIWRISKAGSLIHARLPHASSTWAASRDPALRRPYTIESFHYLSPGRRNGRTHGTFELEHARLRLKASSRSGSSALAGVVEALANHNRGMQYRWERWLSPLIGGFEEFSVVLSAVKASPLA